MPQLGGRDPLRVSNRGQWVHDGIGYVAKIGAGLGGKGTGRGSEAQAVGRFVPREETEPCSAVFYPQNRRLSPDNGFCFGVLFVDSMS
jgi:hypothetical protein